MTIRLLIVDDQELMRDGLVTVLDRQTGIEVVGTAANGREALDQVSALMPDVVLMDVRMPIMDGVTAAKLIHETYSACRVVMLTTFDDEDYVVGALQAGAAGYVLKNTSVENLAAAVRLAQRGLHPLDPAASAQLVVRSGRAAQSAPDANALLQFESLTEREQEVARLIAEGANNREIAERLVVSEGTIKTHVSRILGQLELRDRTQLAIFIYRNRLDG